MTQKLLKKRILTAIGLTTSIIILQTQGAISALSTGKNSSKPLTEHQKEITIKGVVTDKADGQVLPGVSVQVKGTKLGTVTDADGKYSLNIPDDNAILIFTYIGYKPFEVAIKARTAINVSLEISENSLDAVQVVAYGSQKKSSVVGAISTVTIKELKTPTRNLTASLAGKVSGVIAVQRSGEPGYDDATFWIRGISTFGAGTQPLILVDGVERPINNIEPEEIETFSVLKDAAATAPYGIRGANGVVLVTTRRGSKEKPSISFKVEKGVVGATNLPEFADGVTYMNLYNEANNATNPNAPVLYSEDRISKTASGEDPYLYPNVNWQSLMMKDYSDNERLNLNITGGGDVAKYFLSATYYQEGGIFKNNEITPYNTNINVKRYNFRANTDIDLSKTTQLSMGIGGILVTGNYPGRTTDALYTEGIMMNTPVGYAPTYPDPANPDKFVYGGVNGIMNPYQGLTGAGFVNEWKNNIQSDFTINQDLKKFLKGLRLSAKFAFDGYNEHNISRARGLDRRSQDAGDRYRLEPAGRDANGDLVLTKFYDGPENLGFQRTSLGTRRIYYQANVNYDQSFGKHTVSGMVLFNAQDFQRGDVGDAMGSLPYRLLGFVSRATYNYENKYFLEVNAGYNGSENFESGKRFGLFPAVAAGYIISEEPFFKDKIKGIELLKFRGSYGLKGNDQIGGRRFAYVTTIGGGSGGYSFGNTNQTFFNGVGEDQWGSDLTWETETELDLGIETRFLNGFYLQADVFKRNRKGIFLQRGSLPSILGLQNTPYGNIGAFENKGIDANLEYRKQLGGFNVTLRGNYTFARNKIIDNDQPDYQYAYQNRKNKRLNQPFGLLSEGLFRDQEDVNSHAIQQFGAVRPGDIKYKDVNGDGYVNSFDEVAIGNPETPEVIYGFGTTINYKGFDISAFFQGSSNVNFMLGGTGWYPFLEGGIRGNLMSYATDRWTPENQNGSALFPRLSVGNNQNNYRSSTFWQRDASYLRLKTAEFGYTLPKRITSKIKVNTLRVYLSGFNLLTFSKFNFWDPESGSGRAASYPLQRNYNLGVNLNF
ncbi:MAG: TonB-dependent receptor [Pelobium sp.]